MKKYIFAIGLTLAALTSCNKDLMNNDADKSAGIPMTLTATIGDATKISFTKDSGLKGSWNATETISVVSYDSGGNSIAIDNFTSTGLAGRTTAEFTGTFTGGTPYKILCYYPAVYSENGDASYNYISNNVEFTSTDTPLDIYPLKFNVPSQYGRTSLAYVNQSVNDDVSHIARRTVMSGVATVDGSNLNVSLIQNCTVFKLNLTFPAEVTSTIGHVRLICSRSIFGYSGWFYGMNNTNLSAGGTDSTIYTYLGNWGEYGTSPVGLSIPGDKKMTVYLMAFTPKGVLKDDTLTISAYNLLSEPCATKVLTFTSDKNFETGKMYTIEAALEVPAP